MAQRSFVRDALGRFAREAGKKAGAELKKIAKEEAADAARVGKAKINEQVSLAQAELNRAQSDAKAQEATRDQVHTDTDAVQFEVARKKARDRVRKLKLKLGALRVTAAAVK